MIKRVDKSNGLRYNGKAVANAAIAQPVERILGKDEVASSNLASSSKTLKLLEFRGFLFLKSKFMTLSLTDEF